MSAETFSCPWKLSQLSSGRKVGMRQDTQDGILAMRYVPAKDCPQGFDIFLVNGIVSKNKLCRIVWQQNSFRKKGYVIYVKRAGKTGAVQDHLGHCQ